MQKSIKQVRTEIKIKNIQKEINSLVDKFTLAQLDETKEIIKEKIDKNFELIEELKELEK